VRDRCGLDAHDEHSTHSCVLASSQVDEYCKTSDTLELVGYYQANEMSDDLELGTFGRKIADKIRAQNPNAVMLLVRHARIAQVCSPFPTAWQLTNVSQRVCSWMVQACTQHQTTCDWCRWQQRASGAPSSLS
jgi:hypothetical protein